ncbi:hypothetical protein Tco_0591153 [Tanacetum coccineum]
MACSLPYSVEDLRVFVHKQCDVYDKVRYEAIVGVMKLFEHAMAEKKGLRKQYAKCKDISPEGRVIIDKLLEDEMWKDYELKKTLGGIGCLWLTAEEEEQLLRDEEALKEIEEEEILRKFDQLYKEWDGNFGDYSPYDDGYRTD